MELSCKIIPEKFAVYKDKVVKKRLKQTYIIFGCVVSLFCILFICMGAPLVLIGGFILLMLFIITLISVSIGAQLKNQLKHTEFILDKDGIGMFVNKNKLNLMNKIGTAKAEMYGAKTSQFIYFDSISTVDFFNDRIVIKSDKYSALNNTGIVEFPAEAENYEQVKSFIKEIVSKLNLEKTEH